jgi:thiamine-monophosphate kinase
LRSISRYLDPPSASLLVAAPGDDAAVWRGDPFVVATTDTMVEEIDFRLEWPGFDFKTLGRRLIAINLSDLAAMGAEPRHALVSLSLRGTLPVADVGRLYRGIAEQAHRFGATVAGGDLSGTLGPLTLTATLIGRLSSARAILRRTGARPGWVIAVTGQLGGAAAGLRLLESGAPAASKDERAWVRAQLDPTPRIAAGRALVDAGIRVGGDISDGLSREVERLVEDTRLGATIDVDRLPLARGVHRKQWPLAVIDSEDFELICAAPAARMRIARRSLGRLKVPLTVVGEIDGRPGIRYRNGPRIEILKKAGYEHFR